MAINNLVTNWVLILSIVYVVLSILFDVAIFVFYINKQLAADLEIFLPVYLQLEKVVILILVHLFKLST